MSEHFFGFFVEGADAFAEFFLAEHFFAFHVVVIEGVVSAAEDFDFLFHQLGKGGIFFIQLFGVKRIGHGEIIGKIFGVDLSIQIRFNFG